MDERARDLYAQTFALEGLPALARLLPAGFIGLFVGTVCAVLIVPLVELIGGPLTGDALDALFTGIALWVGLPLAGLLAGLPHLLSLLALQGLPGGDRWTVVVRGARAPTPFEDAVMWRALDELDAASGGWVATVLGNTRLFVLEGTELSACVVGTGLYITRPLLDADTRYLAPVLAHELGHLDSGDARLVLALRRFEVPEGKRVAIGADRLAGGAVRAGTLTRHPLGCLLGFWFGLIFKLFGFGRGGLGLRVTGPGWAGYWREREFAADRYAHALGQGRGLIEYLRRNRFLDAAIPYFPLVSEQPYITERIDRLRLLEGDRP